MALTRLGLYGGPQGVVANAAGTVIAALSGTLINNPNEQAIVAGGATVIVSLTEDQWVAAGTTFDAVRQDIIDGFDSAQSELTGWNNEVRDKEVVGAVVRNSPTQVTVTFTASPAYDISSNETITLTVPGSALVGGSPVVATPTFTMLVSSGIGFLSPTLRHRDGTLRHEDGGLRHLDNTLEHLK